ncbi:MAG: hypothetical protein U0996_25050 [Planctomycetaceae bacterium]
MSVIEFAVVDGSMADVLPVGAELAVWGVDDCPEQLEELLNYHDSPEHVLVSRSLETAQAMLNDAPAERLQVFRGVDGVIVAAW